MLSRLVVPHGDSPLSVSTSLAAIDTLAGNQQPGPFDVWFEGTFALFDAKKRPGGRFSTVSLGVDYLVNPDLLVGGLVQLDRLAQHSSIDPSTAAGTGWLAGPDVTARLSDNLYLDLLAAAGTSSNSISPLGTYEDGFDASRWLLSASLQGEWQWDAWTFSPRARLSYFEETIEPYSDSLDVKIPAITVGLGQLAVGPAIAYRLTAGGGVVMDTGLRIEATTDIHSASGFDNLHARIEGTLDLSLPDGVRLGLSAAYDGIGRTRNAASAKVTISQPMP